MQQIGMKNKDLENEVKALLIKLEEETEGNRISNEKNYEELKKLYNEQIEKQKKLYSGNANDHDVIEQLREELRRLAHDKVSLEDLI